MRKMKNSKGFTLMEMLIVVAIIAVLVAIAIPTFTTSLNKARVATDEANIRSGYASVMAEILTSDEKFETEKTYVLKKDGSVVPQAEGVTDLYECFGNSPEAGVRIAGQEAIKWTNGQKVQYTVKANPTEKDKLEVTIKIDQG